MMLLSESVNVECILVWILHVKTLTGVNRINVYMILSSINCWLFKGEQKYFFLKCYIVLTCYPVSFHLKQDTVRFYVLRYLPLSPRYRMLNPLIRFYYEAICLLLFCLISCKIRMKQNKTKQKRKRNTRTHTSTHPTLIPPPHTHKTLC